MSENEEVAISNALREHYLREASKIAQFELEMDERGKVLFKDQTVKENLLSGALADLVQRIN